MDRSREWRVHQHDARHDAGIEVVVDVGGVKLRRGDGRKELSENAGAAVGELVENKGGAGEFGEDGKKAGASRRLQHDVGRRDRGSDAGDKCQPDRCRELLERFAFLGPACVSRKQARDPHQHRQHGARRRRLGAHRGAIPSQEQDGRRLAGVIGGLPVPGTGRIGGTKRRLHGVAQSGGIDAAAALEIGQELSRSPDNRGGNNCGGTHRERRGAGAADDEIRSWEDSFGEREWAEPPGALLKTAAAQTLPGPALPLGSSPTKMGTGAERRPPLSVTNAGRPEPSCDVMLFGGIKLLRPIFVGRGLPLLIIGEEFGQRSRFRLLLQPALLQRRPDAAAPAASRNHREDARPPWPYRPSSDGR